MPSYALPVVPVSAPTSDPAYPAILNAGLFGPDRVN